MQTFLPYPDFKQSAQCLDNRRLGKQRVEVLQILQALTDPNKGWKNHPATLMWKGYENSLVKYGQEICKEWITRGFKDTCHAKITSFQSNLQSNFPSWLGNEKFHNSHKSKLLEKDYNHYSRFFTEPLGLEYFWPTKNGY